MEQTLLVLKPDALRRHLTGNILARFEAVGLELAQIETRKLDSAFVCHHYADLAERRGQRALTLTVRYMTSGPVVACRVEGMGAIANCRRLIGPTMPSEAPPGTIRGDFATASEASSLDAGVAVMNLVHASSGPDEARRELRLWFP